MDKTGGQAFPSKNPTILYPKDISTKLLKQIHTIEVDGKGMTLRDYYEGQIMMGFASRMPYEDIVEIAQGTKGGKYFIRASQNLADAMIAERSK